ncbi:MAG: ATP-binding cassette domain-containing protein [Bacteroidetes bacterium]|nr:ATP-binding cassette domain-containing protein [Bacteroidota bacterium]
MPSSSLRPPLPRFAPPTPNGAAADSPRAIDDPAVLVRADNLQVHFPLHKGVLQRPVGVVQAVDGLTFDIRRRETLGLVGESGCGKSTTGRALLQLQRPTAGRVTFEGTDLTALSERALFPFRKHMQMIFQDPYASLNPRMTVGDIVAEPLRTHGLAHGQRALRRRVQDLMTQVGLDPRYIRRYPHAFSGGQRQRIGIARALATNPQFIVCDEPISALDVSIQAQIMNLMQDLQEEFDLTYLFIAHDLSAVRHISDRIAVMYLGQIVELADAEALYDAPKHPYTQALISAVPIPDPEVEAERTRVVLDGEVPSPVDPPAGCRFHTRCPALKANPSLRTRCTTETPVLREVKGDHQVACHLYDTGPSHELPPQAAP